MNFNNDLSNLNYCETKRKIHFYHELQKKEPLKSSSLWPFWLSKLIQADALLKPFCCYVQQHNMRAIKCEEGGKKLIRNLINLFHNPKWLYFTRFILKIESGAWVIYKISES